MGVLYYIDMRKARMISLFGSECCISSIMRVRESIISGHPNPDFPRASSLPKIANFQVAVLVHLAHNGPRKLLEATAETSRLSRASTQAVPGYLQASDRDAPRSHLRRVEENKDEDEGHGAGDGEGC